MVDSAADAGDFRIDVAGVVQVDRENRGVGRTLPTDRRSRWLD